MKLRVATYNEFPAGLSISKGPDHQLVRSGSPVNFTIHVTNTGLISVTNAAVSDALVSDCNGAGQPEPRRAV